MPKSMSSDDSLVLIEDRDIEISDPMLCVKLLEEYANSEEGRNAVYLKAGKTDYRFAIPGLNNPHTPSWKFVTAEELTSQFKNLTVGAIDMIPTYFHDEATGNWVTKKAFLDIQEGDRSEQWAKWCRFMEDIGLPKTIPGCFPLPPTKEGERKSYFLYGSERVYQGPFGNRERYVASRNPMLSGEFAPDMMILQTNGIIVGRFRTPDDGLTGSKVDDLEKALGGKVLLKTPGHRYETIEYLRGRNIDPQNIFDRYLNDAPTITDFTVLVNVGRAYVSLPQFMKMPGFEKVKNVIRDGPPKPEDYVSVLCVDRIGRSLVPASTLSRTDPVYFQEFAKKHRIHPGPYPDAKYLNAHYAKFSELYINVGQLLKPAEDVKERGAAFRDAYTEKDFFIAKGRAGRLSHYMAVNELHRSRFTKALEDMRLDDDQRMDFKTYVEGNIPNAEEPQTPKRLFTIKSRDGTSRDGGTRDSSRPQERDRQNDRT